MATIYEGRPSSYTPTEDANSYPVPLVQSQWKANLARIAGIGLLVVVLGGILALRLAVPTNFGWPYGTKILTSAGLIAVGVAGIFLIAKSAEMRPEYQEANV